MLVVLLEVLMLQLRQAELNCLPRQHDVVRFCFLLKFCSCKLWIEFVEVPLVFLTFDYLFLFAVLHLVP